MASSKTSVSAPCRNPNHGDIVPLESVVTGEPSRSFVRAASGSVDPERLTRRHSTQALPPSDREIEWNALLNSQRAVLRKLKAWHKWDTDRYRSLSKFLMSKAGFPKRPICPAPCQLFSLATYFFPPRWSLKATVCDFGEGQFERFEVHLEDLQQYWEDKPTWATVR